MKLVSFKSYDDYVRIQTETNRRKLSQVWVGDRELKTIAAYIRRRLPRARFGLCHGVRNGFEVRRLRSLLGIEILGTDIADTATQFPNVIQWDFHEARDEWIGNVDFIYSNSWDHSFAPEKMLACWLRCLTDGGRCFLQWTRNHLPKSVYGADCFGIGYQEFLAWLRSQGCAIERVLRINRLPVSDLFKSPLRWAKGLLAPVRVIVLTRTSPATCYPIGNGERRAR